MDFSKIDEDFRKEIVRGGEAYMDGQVKIATAADARASGLAGMMIGAATALTVGVVIALFNPTWAVFTARLPFVLGGATAAGCFLFGAILCVRAIQPVNFWLPGCEPEAWQSDVATGRLLKDCYGERAQHIQECINDNSATIARNARLFKYGTWLGIAAPFAGLLVWGLASVCRFAG
ncbi:MAG: hypothetical protein K2Y71_27955 [Xanthobacteraceae bacterium]|nr:hypothetical protein [Xanthobacteraceae bacterium]